VDAELAKTPALAVVRLQVKGDFLTSYAWEARGSGLASTVTEEGGQKFYERLAGARRALEKAWALLPGNGRTATLMLQVEVGDSSGRAAMETWFERAMAANGDNRKACQVMLDWIDPKWHGSREEMVAFGRACQDTKNWRSGIPLLVAQVHRRVMGRLPTAKERSDYMLSQEVWDDIRTAYRDHISHFPVDNRTRSEYAGFAYLCSRQQEAHVQFQVLGERLWWGGIFNEAFMKQARGYAAKVSAEQNGKRPE
jgi:hypothetical protein